jgi:hypothetical protein
VTFSPNVGFCHAVNVFFLLDRGTAILGGIHQLVSKAMRHRFFAAIARSINDPAHGECLATGRTNFHGNLVGCAADTT